MQVALLTGEFADAQVAFWLCVNRASGRRRFAGGVQRSCRDARYSSTQSRLLRSCLSPPRYRLEPFPLGRDAQGQVRDAFIGERSGRDQPRRAGEGGHHEAGEVVERPRV